MKLKMIFAVAIVALVACADPTYQGEWVDLRHVFEFDPDTAPETGASTVSFRGRNAAMHNRGEMLSKAKYPKGVTAAFDWNWVRGDFGGTYADQLCIWLNTDGVQAQDRPWENLNGIKVVFDPVDSVVTANRYKDGTHLKVLAKSGNIDFPSHTWHSIRIEHYGDSVSVFHDKKQVLEFAVPEDAQELTKIGITNREPVGPKEVAYKLSILRKVVVTARQ